ncbi:MAG: cation:proton antiporter [Fimbriiglobus sp.]
MTLSVADELTTAQLIAGFAKLDIEELLLPVLIQLIVIIAVARLFGALAKRVWQPSAVGEIIAGLLLGPSLLGWVWPEASQAIFRPQLEHLPQAFSNALFSKIFQVLAQIGLIFLLFLIGLEFEFSHLRVKGRASLFVSLAGIILPFGMGAGLALIIHPYLEPHPTAGVVPLLGLSLFLGTAMSITAIPILGRIMIELGINRTKLGALVISAAAVDDAVGWMLLATVAALAKSAFDWKQTTIMLGATVLFGLAMVYVIRPLLIRFFEKSLRDNQGQLSLNALAVLLLAMFASAIATNLIGIFAIFGAFLLGAVLSDQIQLREAVTAKLRDIVTTFFLPIFFTFTGLRTEVTAVNGTTMWLICGAVFAVAVIGKFGGCGLAARLTGSSWRESSIIGVMMNTRALMELIVINAGYQIGVLPKSLFAMLVLMAIGTTVMTTPILLAIRRGTEIDNPIDLSGFARRNRVV